MRLLIVLFLGCTLPVVAQDDASLTSDFAKLSARERNRIAQKEREEAAADAPYQALMNEAEELFRLKRYEEAMDRYVQARNRRPYNVHPKVKIEDLQVLIAKRDAAIRAAAIPAEPPADTLPTAPEPVLLPAAALPPVVQATRPVASPPAPVGSVEPSPPATEPEPVSAKSPPRAAPVVPPRAETVVPHAGTRPAAVGQVEALPEGIHERIYKEGRALVLERQVVSGGQTIVYRRVTHPWGEVVHFRDGIAVPERTWTEVFGDQ